MSVRTKKNSPFILGLVLILAAPAAAAAWPQEGNGKIPLPPWLVRGVDSEQDWDEIHALDFMLALSLTTKQAQEILPLFEESCRLRTARYEVLADLQPRMLEILPAFLAEDRLNQGFSPEVDERTGKIAHASFLAHKKFVADVNAVGRQVAEILTPPQREIAESYRCGHQSLALALAKRDRQTGLIQIATRQLERRRRSVRPPSAADVELAEARQRFQELEGAIHPKIGSIGRHLLAPAAAASLHELAGAWKPEIVRSASGVWRNGIRKYPIQRCRDDKKKLDDMRREISDWNLVNGLHLNRDQLRRLIELNQRWEHVRDHERKPGMGPHVTADEIKRAKLEIEREASDALHPGQRQVLVNFKPCLIPTPDLKDPVRVGQAQDYSYLAEWLDSTRTINATSLDRSIDRILGQEQAQLGPLSDVERLRRRGQLEAAAGEARKMSVPMFELSVRGLAAEIEPVDRRKPLLARMENLKRDQGRTGKTAQFLLRPEMARVLRVRHEQLGGKLRTKRANLAKGPQAENCDKGCALNH